jgi:membrane protein involved in colicin uptake
VRFQRCQAEAERQRAEQLEHDEHDRVAARAKDEAEEAPRAGLAEPARLHGGLIMLSCSEQATTRGCTT